MITSYKSAYYFNIQHTYPHTSDLFLLNFEKV